MSGARATKYLLSMKSLRALIPLSLIVLLLAACGGGGGANLSSNDVAVVGSEHITQAMFDQELAVAKAGLTAQGQKLPAAGSTQYAAFRTNIVELLVQQAELRLAAAKLGVTAPPAQVAKQIAAIKKKYFKGNEKQFLAGLKAQGFTDPQFESYITEQVLEANLYKAITKGAAPTQSAVDAYYSANISQYQQPATRAVQEILVGKNKEKLADQIYAQLKAGASFATLAKKYSQDPGSKDKGGKFTASKGSDVPEFDAAVFAPTARTGQLLKPVNTAQYGWFVIQPVAAISPGKTTSEKDATTAIRKQLESTKQQQLASDWMSKTVKSYCSGGKISYQTGYEPSPDPCVTLSQSDQTTT
jgi:parvulin-like peptidyl-prolyl isomerase